MTGEGINSTNICPEFTGITVVPEVRVHEDVGELRIAKFDFRPIVIEDGSVYFTDVAKMAK